MGNQVQLFEGVMRGLWERSGAAFFDFSENGTLVFIRDTIESTLYSLAVINREGILHDLPSEPAVYSCPRFSPDGKKVAVAIEKESGEQEIYTYDIFKEQLTQITFGGGDDPCWSSDGKLIAFSSTRDGIDNIYYKPSNGTGKVTRLLPSENWQYPMSWSVKDEILVFGETIPNSGDTNIFLTSTQKDPIQRGLVHASEWENNGDLSPDGKWLVYQSGGMGDWKIFVQPVLGDMSDRMRITNAKNCVWPVWTKQGSEILYIDADLRKVFSIAISYQPSFRWENPVETSVAIDLDVFSAQAFYNAGLWDVTQDGENILILKPVESKMPLQLNIFFNWFEELKLLMSLEK
jgi:Tol biopolymer transport system component